VILLDTDLLSIIQRASGFEYECLARRLDSAHEEVVVSIISFEEQMRGWLAYIARAKTPNQLIGGYTRLRALLEDSTTRPILDFDQACARQFEKLNHLKLRVGTMDLKIAATSLAHDSLLLSRNLKDFRKVPGLRAEDWSSP
jgi:tRNA(fMet)-specific endonuclease VapC